MKNVNMCKMCAFAVADTHTES